MNDLRIETVEVIYNRPKNSDASPQTPGLVAGTCRINPSKVELMITAYPDRGEGDCWHTASVALSKRKMLELAAYLVNAVKEMEGGQ